MIDWERVKRDLANAGYPGFEFDSGGTAVPGLSGEWVVGRIAREGPLARSNLPFPLRLLDALPFGTTLPTDPACAPEDLRRIAGAHDLAVIIISGDGDSTRIALCDSARD